MTLVHLYGEGWGLKALVCYVVGHPIGCASCSGEFACFAPEKRQIFKYLLVLMRSFISCAHAHAFGCLWLCKTSRVAKEWQRCRFGLHLEGAPPRRHMWLQAHQTFTSLTYCH